jgi:cephalosporin hydroxylase
MANERSLVFKNREHGRYWWFKAEGATYVPPVYSFLSDAEWKIMDEWYNETDEKNLAAECNVSLMCILQGFIMGSIVKRVVQFGTSQGYSALLIGFMLRRMGVKNSFVTIDINDKANEFTNLYVERAGLKEYINVVTSDSIDPDLPEYCKKHIHGNPQIIIIDSSHQYKHTLQELELWYQYLDINGFIFLHDTSKKAIDYDSTKEGGVQRSLNEWSVKNNINYININKLAEVHTKASELTYLDGCGLGIIQKI